ncbi:MAG: tetratricopeptide repeat protein [Spirulinaceae cyanobacterium]
MFNVMALGIGKVLRGRYGILSQLGQGGFGRTFLAEDGDLVDRPQCVVKQLKTPFAELATLKIAQRLFENEARILQKLGHHAQIPQLFAYFEEEKEFYLVQEYIAGSSLVEEVSPGQKLAEKQVIVLLIEILTVLEFVHGQKVIHRDLNPRNLIRRQDNGQLVLIDFGAVKQISTATESNKTIVIGTPGYLPIEQSRGNPQLSSDVYAVGMMGIVALTGGNPTVLAPDSQTREIAWQDGAAVSPELTQVLSKMIRQDYHQRYASASEALVALKSLNSSGNNTIVLPLPPQPLPKFKLTRSLVAKVVITLGLVGLGITVFFGVGKLIRGNNATNLYNQGNTLYELNRYQEAFRAYDQALELNPDYVEAWKGQGDSLQGLQREEEALEAYEQAIQLQPDYWEAWIARGELLAKLTRYSQAVQAFAKVIEHQPDNWQAWEGKGDGELKLKQYSQAIASYNRVLDLNGERTSAWYSQGWAFHNLKRYEKAVDAYDQAVDIQPDYPQAWYQRGNALINLQAYEAAADSYQKALNFQPNFHQAAYSLGIALNHEKEYEEAVKAFEQALKAKSDNSQAWYNLGWSLHQLQRYTDAVAAYEQATKYGNNSYSAWYNRGNALYKLEKYAEAIASYDQALVLEKSRYQAWFSRGNALLNLKQYQDAIASYEQALSYKPNYQEAEEGKRRSRRLLEKQERDNRLRDKPKEKEKETLDI